MIYLDSAATTLQKPQAVIRSTVFALKQLSSPGRGGYSAAMKSSNVLFECRERAASLFNVGDPSSVVITSSATHGLNIAIKSLAAKGKKVVISGYEHNAVTRPLRAVGAEVEVASSELFEPEVAVFEFERRLAGRPSLVVINHVSNVFGYIQPVERIAKICRAKKIPFIIDASQSAGIINLDFEKLGADFVAMPGHKGLYGPQGTGLLLCARVPEGIIQGGTGGNSRLQTMPEFLPDRLEAGTHNVPGIAGLNAGIKFVLDYGVNNILEHERELACETASLLSEIDGVRVFKGEFDYCQSGLVSFVVRGLSCEAVGEQLGRRDIAVRVGLHCAPLAHKTAGTLGSGTVRVSFSLFNTQREVRSLACAVKEISRAKNSAGDG